MKPIPTHGTLFAEGKSGPNASFDLVFLGLSWPWVAGSSSVLSTFSNPAEFGKSQNILSTVQYTWN